MDSSTQNRLLARAGSPFGILVGSAVLMTGLYFALTWLSRDFAYGTESTEQPIGLFFTLIGGVFAGYIAAIVVALRITEQRRLLWIIISFAVLFRIMLLFSCPILEIDIYRYLWDGCATLEGVNPYRYSPDQVQDASDADSLPADLRRLHALSDNDDAVGTILSRVHYGNLPTIYPPVSQAVFAAVTAVTPTGSSVTIRLMAMKAAFVVFDLATLVLVIQLLRLAGQHVGWSIAYGWCPLVIKESANSGHLDSLAVFLTTAALYMALKSFAGNTTDRHGIAGTRGSVQSGSILSALLLALAIGAKLYPLVLAPLLLAMWHRHRGWRGASVATIVLTIVTVAVMWPMIPSHSDVADAAGGTQSVAPQTADDADQAIAAPPVPEETLDTRPQDPSGGLQVFLKRWEMNDFIFMLVVENLKDLSTLPYEKRAWFAVTPAAWRQMLVDQPWSQFGIETSRRPFFVTRLLTLGVFLLIVAGVTVRAWMSLDPACWLHAAFLTLAWFWLLSPTQNPWYWTWAMPLVVFSRSRAWLAVSGLAFIYYSRFWLDFHYSDAPVCGTRYSGALFFDFIMTWIEFAPWFAWLTIASIVEPFRRKMTDIRVASASADEEKGKVS